MTTWTHNLIEFIRQDDGERIGYLRPVGDLWKPLNLLGISLSDRDQRDRAEMILLEKAMPSIVEPYWCKIPRPLTEAVIDARTVDEEEWFHQVLVVEITQSLASLKPKSPFESEQSAIINVRLPADDVLFLQQPDW